MVNFGHWRLRSVSMVWGTPANFNGSRILASLLHHRRSAEVNQTLHDVWPYPGLVHYINFRGLLPPNWILPCVKFTLRPSLAFPYIGSVTARHSVSQTLRCSAEGATYIRQGGHHVGHRPSFELVITWFYFYVTLHGSVQPVVCWYAVKKLLTHAYFLLLDHGSGTACLEQSASTLTIFRRQLKLYLL